MHNSLIKCIFFTNWFFWMESDLIHRPSMTGELIKDPTGCCVPNIHKPTAQTHCINLKHNHTVQALHKPRKNAHTCQQNQLQSYSHQETKSIGEDSKRQEKNSKYKTLWSCLKNTFHSKHSGNYFPFYKQLG